MVLKEDSGGPPSLTSSLLRELFVHGLKSGWWRVRA